MTARSTLVVHGPLAARDARLRAGRKTAHGTQILSVEGLAARLAGGFSRPVDWTGAKKIIAEVLGQVRLFDLEGIRDLPGTPVAAAATLRKAWDSGHAFDPPAKDAVPRLLAMAEIETALLSRLPPGDLRPADLVSRALARLEHAPSVLGHVVFSNLHDLAPVWRQLAVALAAHVSVTWEAGARAAPGWLAGTGITVRQCPPSDPRVETFSAATAPHEALEALRWARSLVASGLAKPDEIAIAACATGEYDDAFAALRREANFPLRFVHGLPACATGEGQSAAALADLLVRGMRRPAVLRVAALCAGKRLAALPRGWASCCPHGALSSDLEAWRGSLEVSGLAAAEIGSVLELVRLLGRGPDAAEEAGEACLAGGARGLWRKSLVEGPPHAIAATLATLRIEDSEETREAVCWVPASLLAAAPRRFVRLLGLSSRGWPRRAAEDPLVPDHVLDPRILEPIPTAERDRADFRAILESAEEVAISRPRRDGEGRLLGRSPLLRGLAPETYLARNAPSRHAASEGDRLLGRPDEFALTAVADKAAASWLSRHSTEFTAHDGFVRAPHPSLARVLARRQSPTSLAALLRDAPGFVFRYALGMYDDDADEFLLILDARSYGNLLHRILELAVKQVSQLPAHGHGADPAMIRAIADAAAAAARAEWERREGAPPKLIWERQIAEAVLQAQRVILGRPTPFAGQKTFVEVAFGGAAPKSEGDVRPWDDEPVEIPGTSMRVSGYIDRLDLSGDGGSAIVVDYKTGRPTSEGTIIGGGSELQRSLYALAVRQLLCPAILVDARLHYVVQDAVRPLPDPEAAIEQLAGAVREAAAMVSGGRLVPGPDTFGSYARHLLAWPANAAAGYVPRKKAAFASAARAAATVWGED